MITQEIPTIVEIAQGLLGTGLLARIAMERAFGTDFARLSAETAEHAEASFVVALEELAGVVRCSRCGLWIEAGEVPAAAEETVCGDCWFELRMQEDELEFAA